MKHLKRVTLHVYGSRYLGRDSFSVEGDITMHFVPPIEVEDGDDLSSILTEYGVMNDFLGAVAESTSATVEWDDEED